MSFTTRIFIVNNIKLPINASVEEAFSVSIGRLKALGINTDALQLSVYRRSTDARNKDNIFFVYSIAVKGDLPNVSEKKLMQNGISVATDEGILPITYGDTPLSNRPLVVGTGPCGLFSALLLAENGYNPIVIERGGSVEERKRAIESFKKLRILDTDTNIQFGAGGAGTFSDGKLVTRINDPLTSYVLKKFVEFGASEDILYIAKPHIGTDVLSDIVDKMLTRITELGGTVLYHTKLLDIVNQDGISVAKTTKGDIEFGAMILAIGHSARDTYQTLLNKGYAIEPKPFSVGMRIEHLKDDIDKAMYGKYAGSSLLGSAEYNLSYDTKNRGVYTFCMCPGGTVVSASSEEGGVVVNGMSNHKRDGINSNSAVVCSIFKEDYGSTPMGAINFQRNIEKRAFEVGGKNYSAPIITVGDFLSGKCSSEPTKITPTYMDGEGVKIASPEGYLPDFVCSSIRNALYNFDKKINGFATETAILTGAETRTSAPIRILRDFDTRTALGKENIYPAGEGAGYAGGITSASIDGVKTAIAVMKKYKPYGR